MQVVGQKRFVGLYLAGGLLSSLAYLGYQNIKPLARIAGTSPSPPPPPPRLPFLYSFPLHMHAPDVPPHVVRSSFDPGLYRRRQGALGASGAVSAITMFSVCVNPRATFMLWMVLPVPAIVFGVGYVAYDLWGAYTGTSNTGVLLLGLCVLVGLCSHARWWQCCVSGQHGTAHAGHLGGALAGVAYYLLIRKRLIRRW